MSKFYFLLWLKWAIRLIICSTLLAIFLTSLITLYFYILQNMPNLTTDVRLALQNIFEFWFKIIWNLTLLIALFRGLKYIFNDCINGYELKLLECKDETTKEKEIIEVVGYGDLPKVWRKWFMLNIWLISFFMIIALIYTNFFTSLSGVFEWFNIYWLFGFILLSGYFSFILLGARCKMIKLKKC